MTTEMKPISTLLDEAWEHHYNKETEYVRLFESYGLMQASCKRAERLVAEGRDPCGYIPKQLVNNQKALNNCAVRLEECRAEVEKARQAYLNLKIQQQNLGLESD